MAPSAPTSLSPAELSYIHTSLSSSPPLRPDGRTTTQFRPVVAETDILPNANGSARVCFADGTEAIVGVKAEVERTDKRGPASETLAENVGPDGEFQGRGEEVNGSDEEDESNAGVGGRGRAQGRNEWLELSIEIPGFRDDDALPVFLSQMLSEALLAGGNGGLRDQLFINPLWHWKLYVDILSLSPPLSYPLPLLSLTVHLALLSTRIPRVISTGDGDPLFDDDWEAATYLYPPSSPLKPPMTLLVMSVGDNIIFDPSRQELAVAEAVVAVSIASSITTTSQRPNGRSDAVKLLSLRTIDPPSRLTQPGIPDAINTATGGTAPASGQDAIALKEARSGVGDVWTPPRGGMKRATLRRMIDEVCREGGLGQDVLASLDGIDV